MLGGGVMGAEPRVEKTQFLLRPRKIGVEHQQAFERADRRLVIPQFGREQDIAIGRVIIRRPLANVIGETRLFVLTSPSGRAGSFWTEAPWRELAVLARKRA